MFYSESNISKFKIYTRSISIDSKKSFIYGPPKSGKTMFALNYAKKFTNTLYVNMSLYSIESLFDILLEKILSSINSVDLFIVDKFNHSLLKIPDFNKLLKIPTNVMLIGDMSEYTDDLSQFKKFLIYPLSFEEYLGFDNKNLSVVQLLANFLRDGNSPDIFFSPNSIRQERKIQNLKLELGNDFYLFFHLLFFQSSKISIYLIFCYLKKHIKISKDKLYYIIEKYQKEGLIYLCKYLNYNNKKHKDKIYFFDFSLFELTGRKEFNKVFENMVFLELYSMGLELFYDDDFDFIAPSMNFAFLCVPFCRVSSVFQKIKNKYKFNSNYKIFAISMNLNYKINAHINIIDFTNLYELRSLVWKK